MSLQATPHISGALTYSHGWFIHTSGIARELVISVLKLNLKSACQFHPWTNHPRFFADALHQLEFLFICVVNDLPQKEEKLKMQIFLVIFAIWMNIKFPDLVIHEQISLNLSMSHIESIVTEATVVDQLFLAASVGHFMEAAQWWKAVC